MVWVKKTEKNTQSQHIYLSCNDKGRSGMKSAERARSIYSEEQEKNRVSGTKPSDSRSEYVIRNKKKNQFPESSLVIPSTYVRVFLRQRKQGKNVIRERTLYFRERLVLKYIKNQISGTFPSVSAHVYIELRLQKPSFPSTET